ncbi:DEAD/DEAH box helicase [Streptomyces ossamyceticus]|nr:DEAD/DEAH box helicase [Streptomyces ossamyceticus]
MTLPVALSGTDVIGQAKTGTGKTLGFGLPLLERVTVPADVEAGRAKPEDLTDAPQALVVVPTRELCTQVTNDLLTAGKVRNVRVTAIYGGRAYEPQVEALKKGVDVVIGTPGRLLDLAGQKKLNLKHVKCLVLDEADEMLDLGFLPDVEKIINMLPARRQTMLFSATMPGAVIGLARRYMSQPTHIRATAPDDEGATVANTSQHVYRAHNMDKPEMVARILQADGRGLAMVFCRTKRTAADLADQLKQRGFASGAVHGDLGQGAREQALRAFRNGKVDVLVCTDVAARGIDVEGVTHVINYQSPEDEKTYLHRIGRTGRAGAKGIAITLVDWDDIPRWQLINKALELNFNDPPETYSTSPHLFEELNIPAGTKGVLPRSERTRAGLDAEELEDLGEPGGRGARGRGGRSSGPAPSAERERPARTPRSRRRTRGGATVDATAPEATITESTRPAETPGTATEADAGPRTPRRRRRTRSGATSTARTVTSAVEAQGSEKALDATTTDAADAVKASALSTVEDVRDTADTAGALPAADEAKPRRRRTRKTASAEPVEAPAAEVTVEAVAEVTVEAVAEEVAPKTRRRTRKATEAPVAAEAPTAEAALDTAEGTPATEEASPKTRRRTTRKTAATAEVTAEAVTEEAAPKTRRRTRKVAETPVDAVDAVDAVETTVAEEAAPKTRRRTRKAAEAPVAAEAPTAEAALDSAEGTPATEEAAPKTRRRTTRKTAATAEVTGDATATAEESAPKTRRRTTRKVAEAPVDASETVAVAEEAAPKTRRRTRKVAEAPLEASVPAQPTEKQATKPRRTRKAAAPAVAAVEDAGAGAAETPAPRRRVRKTAAAVEPTDG